jgi:hypothetical protein
VIKVVFSVVTEIKDYYFRREVTSGLPKGGGGGGGNCGGSTSPPSEIIVLYYYCIFYSLNSHQRVSAETCW